MTKRVPLNLAAAICGVKPGTIRRWVHDRRIIRHHDECTDPAACTGEDYYDVHELLQWIDARNPDALMVRAGVEGDHATRLARPA